MILAASTLGATQLEDWRRVVAGPTADVSGEGSIRFPDRVTVERLSDVVPSVVVVSVFVLALAVLVLLVGPRARSGVLVLVIAGNIAVIGLCLTSQQTAPFGGPVAGSAREDVSRGPARPATSAAAGVAAISALVAFAPARGVPRLGIPERAHDERA